MIVIVAIIVGVIFVQQGDSQNSGTIRETCGWRKMYGGQSTHIPLKVNGAGVIPVIFAVSLLMFPITIAQFLVDTPLGTMGSKSYVLRQAAWHGVVVVTDYRVSHSFTLSCKSIRCRWLIK